MKYRRNKIYIEEKKLWLLAEYAIHNLKQTNLQVLYNEKSFRGVRGESKENLSFEK